MLVSYLLLRDVLTYLFDERKIIANMFKNTLWELYLTHCELLSMLYLNNSQTYVELIFTCLYIVLIYGFFSMYNLCVLI